MQDLKQLYDISAPEGCNDCGILRKSKPQHYIREDLKPADILFISDSFKLIGGNFFPFRVEELDVITDTLLKLGYHDLLENIQFTASVKCPNVKESDMDKDDKNLCREHLYSSIESVRPKLIFACGNLPLVMLTKKSGIMNKRGKEFILKLESGFECIIIPTYHPWQIVAEPGNAYLFELDINKGISTHITKSLNTAKFEFDFIDTNEKIDKYKFLYNTVFDISCDIETTGFDYNSDYINTIAFSWKNDKDVYTNICLPIYHKDTPKTIDPKLVLEFSANVLKSRNNKKIFHNGKFDMRFLHRAGVREFHNCRDTQFMQHIVNENVPKRLANCVEYYFAEEVGRMKIKDGKEEIENE